MNNLVSTLELSSDFNECCIAVRRIWNRFSAITSFSEQDILEYEKLYLAILTCSERFCNYAPQPAQEQQFNELIVHLLQLIHLAESPSIPMHLSPRHFLVLSKLITIAANASLIDHFLKELLSYLKSPFLHTLAFNRLLTLGMEQARKNNTNILEVLSQTPQLKSMQESQIFQLRNMLLSLIPHAMLFVSPPSPIVQMVTHIDKFLKSINEQS